LRRVRRDVELEGVQSFRCPNCGEPCSDLRQGGNWRSIRSRLTTVRRRDDDQDCGAAAGILKKNDELAAGLRASYAAAGVLVLNLVSSPERQDGLFGTDAARVAGARGAGGAGGRSGDGQRCAAAGRERRSGPANQYAWNLSPGRGDDHEAPGRVGVGRARLLFIENVGNLVCRRATTWERRFAWCC